MAMRMCRFYRTFRENTEKLSKKMDFLNSAYKRTKVKGTVF
jgi:hypothetical protein